jgi:hypothetical protein
MSDNARNPPLLTMPNWTQCLQAIVLLAITGFCLVVVSYHWLLLAVLIVTAFVAFRRFSK